MDGSGFLRILSLVVGSVFSATGVVSDLSDWSEGTEETEVDGVVLTGTDGAAAAVGAVLFFARMRGLISFLLDSMTNNDLANMPQQCAVTLQAMALQV